MRPNTRHHSRGDEFHFDSPVHSATVPVDGNDNPSHCHHIVDFDRGRSQSQQYSTAVDVYICSRTVLFPGGDSHSNITQRERVAGNW